MKATSQHQTAHPNVKQHKTNKRSPPPNNPNN